MLGTRIGLLFSCLIIAACAQNEDNTSKKVKASQPHVNNAADILFLGEHILTMDPSSQGANSVAVRGDKIVYVGDKSGAVELTDENTRVISLNDQALIPGFVDSHGHISMTARFIDYVNLSATPVGQVNKIDDLIRVLSQRLADQPPGPEQWLIGYGYDDSLLTEQRHPTRNDLDKVAKDIPIFILHVSAHLAVVNSAALQELGINANTPNPAGGIIRREVNSMVPNGVLEEKAIIPIMIAQMSSNSPEQLIEKLRKATALYASYGITTAQDGAASPADIKLMREAAVNKPFMVDIGAYVYTDPKTVKPDSNTVYEKQYTGGFRVAGVKLSLDGSPQGRTAWLTQPYTQGPEGANPEYVAYSTVEPEDYIKAATQLIRSETPIIVHANGDAAIDLMLEGVEQALNDGQNRDHRSTIIHAQLMRSDQVEKAAKLGAVASFFSAHSFFWGDWHQLSFGEARGQNISPTHWAINRNLNFTIHNDAPVVPPDMMRLLWATVNRQGRSGNIIGGHQRIDAMAALNAATLAGAYQYFEEGSKGSITLGKRADLVILENNPVKVDPQSIKDIDIIETFARGKSVYLNRN